MLRFTLPTLLAALVATAFAAGGGDPVHSAIRRAVSDDPSEQVIGIRQLRQRGEDGLDAVLEAERAGWIEASPGQWNHAIDQVAGQRDARWSGLYWHTDLDAAKAQAAEEGKPILSLRLLGDLREATSCANSRFFRAILYTHPELASRMDSDFVLHWSSERDVPQITIRFGDGRELHSTLTGNSAHYVLDAEGRPLDVIPGLYTPDAFLAELESARALFTATESEPARRAELLVAHHTRERDAAVARVRLSTEGIDPRSTVLSAPIFAPPVEPRFASEAVPASLAIPIAMGKGRVEAPFATFTGWSGVGDLFGPEDLLVTETGTLHEESLRFIRSQDPDPSEEAHQAMVDRFTRTVQADSTWNRDVLHARVHDWFASGFLPDFDQLNTRLYADLFATPASDPWLGLYDSTVYTGLQGAGIVRKGLEAR